MSRSATSDADHLSDVERLFREHDHLGADSSLWLRAARMLMDQGKPLGQLTVLACKSSEGGSLPFGAMTQTKSNRIVFWPVLPRHTQMTAEKHRIGVIDHLTLELPSERIHATAYDAAGRSQHYAASDLGHEQAWRLQHFEGTNLALWFKLAFRRSVLAEQERAVQRRIPAPTLDVQRRVREFSRFAGRIKVVDVPLPSGVSDPTYVVCVAYLVTDTSGSVDFRSDVFTTSDLDGEVDGFSAGSIFEVRPLALRYAERQFVFATACPAGNLKQDVIVGFPRQPDDRGHLAGGQDTCPRNWKRAPGSTTPNGDRSMNRCRYELDLDAAVRSLERMNSSPTMLASDRIVAHLFGPVTGLNQPAVAAERVAVLDGLWGTRLFMEAGAADLIVSSIVRHAPALVDMIQDLHDHDLENRPDRVISVARKAMPVILTHSEPSEHFRQNYSFAAKFFHWCTRVHFPIVDSRARKRVSAMQAALGVQPRVRKDTAAMGGLTYPEEYERWITFYSDLIAGLSPSDRERLCRDDYDSQPHAFRIKNSLLRILDKVFYVQGGGSGLGRVAR